MYDIIITHRQSPVDESIGYYYTCGMEKYGLKNLIVFLNIPIIKEDLLYISEAMINEIVSQKSKFVSLNCGNKTILFDVLGVETWNDVEYIRLCIFPNSENKSIEESDAYMNETMPIRNYIPYFLKTEKIPDIKYESLKDLKDSINKEALSDKEKWDLYFQSRR